METTLTAVKPMEPGKPVDILERDKHGHLVGAWIGYWSFQRQTVTLYPNVRNRFVNWPGGRIPQSKRLVSDRVVYEAAQKGENTPHPSAKPTPSPAGEGYEGDGRRSRKAPLEGQQKIKF